MIPAVAPDGSRGRVSRPWQALRLAGILALSLGLHFFRLDREGFSNLYYSAAARSILSSWHNFFFASFDPAGFVSVDKPPLGLWVQAGSAALFGYRGWSLLFPQALAGVLSTAVLYNLVARRFDKTAGLLAALILTVTPIFVAANRSNNTDSLLVLTLLLSAWCATHAAEKGRPIGLYASAFLLGLGFNIKMLQAFLILPALIILYLSAARLPLWKRIAHLMLAGSLLAVVSFSWAVIVDLTPASSRPYVGSSTNNSVIELTFGHNGLERLGAIAGWLGITGKGGPWRSAGPLAANNTLLNETGNPGMLRLFNHQLAGQISWFLPLAGLGLVAAWMDGRRKPDQNMRRRNLLFWACWLVPQVIFFSFAGFFHRHYLELMAPSIAALSGVGLVSAFGRSKALSEPPLPDQMLSDRTEPASTGRILLHSAWLPAMLLAALGTSLLILKDFPDQGRLLAPLLIGIELPLGIGLLLLPAARSKLELSSQASLVLSAACGGLSLGVLLVVPLIWAAIPVLYLGDPGLPYAGPELLTRPQIRRDFSRPALNEYLLENYRGEKYLLATFDARSAAPLIIDTGMPVMAMGGFTGSDPILSLQNLQAMVARSEVRYFLLPYGPPGRRLPSNPANQNASDVRAPYRLMGMIAESCREVSEAEWNKGTLAFQAPADLLPPIEQLWDCGP